MKKLVFLFLTSLLTISNAIAQNAAAAKYNNKLFTLQYKASEHIVKFFELVKTGDVAKITEAHTNVDKSLDKTIAKVAKFKAFEGDSSIKVAVLDWLKGYEKTFDNEYKQMLPLISKKSRTAEDNAKLNQMHDDLIVQEKSMDEKLAEIQKVFATKHNLTLEKAETK